MYSRVLTGVGASIAAETDGVPGLGLASASAAARLLIVGCWFLGFAQFRPSISHVEVGCAHLFLVLLRSLIGHTTLCVL